MTDSRTSQFDDSSRGSSSADDPTRIGRADEPTRVSDIGPRRAPRLDPGLVEGYEIVEELHRGGQGVVYRAIQLGTKRQVALKVLLEGPLASDANRLRFEREVELAASLRHPNIVTILGSGVSYGRYYLAMEFIDGLRLDKYLARIRPPLRDTLHLFESICNAVNFAHQRGVIHRDLKPPNILVDGEGEPRILDFGLAKPITHGHSEQETYKVLSAAGELLGTVAYMSPEQTTGSDVDVRSDVYSLGVVYYESLLGKLPYRVDGPLGEVLTRIANDDPARPRVVRRQSRFGYQINDELETILLKALEKHPVRRYQTAGEFGRDLRHLLRGEPIEAKRASGMYMFRKTLKRYKFQATVASFVLVGMVLALVAFAFLWTSAQQASERAGKREQDARQAAMDARRARADLERALIQQTIQRGELAYTRGDVGAARDRFWDAFEQADIPATRWALRQYYNDSGDAGATVLHYRSAGPTALSPDARLAASCETPTTIVVRDIARGRVLAWREAPRAVDILYVDNHGNVSAAGNGWARLWRGDAQRPAVAVELDRRRSILAAYSDSTGTRLLLVDPGTVECCAGANGQVISRVRLGGRVIGAVDYAERRDQLLVPTTAGVQRISLVDNALRDDWLGRPERVEPRAAHFSGNELLAISPSGIYAAPDELSARAGWRYIGASPADWQYFDISDPASTMAFSLPDGVVVQSTQDGRSTQWRASARALTGLRIGEDGQSVTTVDDEGVLTRWFPPNQRGLSGSLMDREPVAWAVASDGTGVLLSDDNERVTAYAPGRSAAPFRINARSFFVMRSSMPLMATSTHGLRSIVCVDDSVRLVLANRPREALTSTWDDPIAKELNHVALSGDGETIAFCAQTPAGERQRIFFKKWQSAVPFGRRRLVSTFLPPLGGPVELTGSVVRQMAFQPGKNRLLVARSNGDLLWLRGEEDPEDSSEVRAAAAPWVRLDSPPTAFAFDPTGEHVAIACEDGQIRLLSTEDLNQRMHFRAAAGVRIVSFDPLGDVLLTCTDAGAVTIYDVTNGRRVAQLGSGTEQYVFAAWVGNSETLLLGTEAGVQRRAYRSTDELIARNLGFARQRAVSRFLGEGDFVAAWQAATTMERISPRQAQEAREAICAAALARPGYEVPGEWRDLAHPNAEVATLLRLGYAAYEGERFELAASWLQTACAKLGEDVGAYTLQRRAQCEYLLGQWQAAAEGFAALTLRPDLDARDVPLVQLMQAAALVMNDDREAARVVAAQIGSVRADASDYDGVASGFALDIARYLTGLETTNPAIAFVERFVQPAVTAGFGSDDAMRFHDDTPFFVAELARKRGEVNEATAQYQRCIDLARDQWPSNWARYRLSNLSGPVQ